MRALIALALLLATGCSGLIARPGAADTATPLAKGQDDRIEVVLQAVLLRNAKDAWVRHADWDQYAFRIKSRGPALTVRKVTIADALGTPIEPSADRSKLVDDTHETAQRYQRSGQLVRSKEGGWMFVGGAGLYAGGSAVLSAMAPSIALGGGMALAVVPAAMIVGGAVLGGVAINRVVSNVRIDNAIKDRATALPAAVAEGGEATVVLFYPITPLPRGIEVEYAAGASDHRIEIDAREALAKLHDEPLPSVKRRVEPEFPLKARREGISAGYVKARLAIEPNGAVDNVQILESQPAGVFDREAATVWKLWRFSPARWDTSTRFVDETFTFQREK